MKAKFLMMAAFGAMAVTLGSCSDDPKNDFPESEFTIRQLRLDAVNGSNASEARSSENPTNGSTTLDLLTVTPDGQTVTYSDGEPVLSRVSFVKPTDAIMGVAGDNVTVTFTPGNVVVKSANITLPNGETKVLTEEEPSLDYVLGDFVDGCVLEGLDVVRANGSVYNYCGSLYFWHYHPINLTVTNDATGEVAYTTKYDAAANALVRKVVLDDNGNIKYDSDGYPTFIGTSELEAVEGQTLKVSFDPAYASDVLVVSLPDGTGMVLSAENPAQNWTVNAFDGEATISAVLELMQANDVPLKFTGSITLKN